MPQASQDPWQHRSAGMRCDSCMWYVPKVSASGALVGRCRRHAPSMQGYPVVFAHDWCGDHKLDENSLPPPRRKAVATPPPWDDPDGDGLQPAVPLHDPATCQFCQDAETAVPFQPED